MSPTTVAQQFETPSLAVRNPRITPDHVTAARSAGVRCGVLLGVVIGAALALGGAVLQQYALR